MSLSLDFGAILGSASSIVARQATLRAQIEWARIQDKGTDIELRRGDVFLSPQTVRIEMDDTFPQDAADDSGVNYAQRLQLFGVQGHPTIDDLDIDLLDRFILENQEYTIIGVNRHLIGQIQADAEAIG